MILTALYCQTGLVVREFTVSWNRSNDPSWGVPHPLSISNAQILNTLYALNVIIGHDGVNWSLYSDVVAVLGVHASVRFVQASGDSLKTGSYSAPPCSFDWISSKSVKSSQMTTGVRCMKRFLNYPHFLNTQIPL